MKDDDLYTLFQSNNLPTPSAETKNKHLGAAMDAFRKNQIENTQNNSQGNTADTRPIHTYPPVRNRNMRFALNRTWIGAMAASVLVVIGFVNFAPKNASTPFLTDKDLSRNGQASPKAHIDQTHQLNVQEAELSKAIKDNSHKKEAYDRALPSERVAAQPAKTQAVSAEEIRTLHEAKPTAIAAGVTHDSLAPPEPIVDRNRFSHVAENSVLQVKSNPVSTFSVDVDTASYSYVRRQLNQGALPAKDAVRIEELINYFDYNYPLPKNKQEPFATHVNVMDSPWNPGKKLLHIGIKGYDIAEQPDSNLVFLLDVSGSMDSPDKLPLVKQSMGLLLDTLKPTDTVSIVVYAGAAGTVLSPTLAKEKTTILAALDRLQAGGSTAGGQGLALAYSLAENNFQKNAINRVILATDGDFNVGVTQDQKLEDFVARKREKGIYLSVLGFGTGNYQDALMQTLAQNGNGIAAYIDTLSEAQKVLVHQATSSLFPIANDVKIQIEFNPATVSEYRLVGYETRALRREDFNNDKIDAGDIGSGHSVTAIYEITPVDSNNKIMDNLRYEQSTTAKHQNTQNEYAFLKLRYKLPGENQSKLISTPIFSTTESDPSTQKEMRFAAAVAGFGQLLKGGNYLTKYNYLDVIKTAQENKGADSFGYRTEFIQLVRKAQLAK